MNEAIKALKAGDRKTAYRLLRRHLRANPKDVNAWLWISQATTEQKKQIDALQQVLALAPQHPRAKAIGKRLRKLNRELNRNLNKPSSVTARKHDDEYPLDNLLAEVRAELEKHSAHKEANVLASEAEPTSTPARSSNEPKQKRSKVDSVKKTFSDEDIDLILELQNSVEDAKKKAAKAKPSASAVPSVVPSYNNGASSPAAKGVIPSPPASSLPAAEDAVAVIPQPSNRKNLVLWMWGVLILSIIVVVVVIFIMPNLPPSN